MECEGTEVGSHTIVITNSVKYYSSSSSGLWLLMSPTSSTVNTLQDGSVI